MLGDQALDNAWLTEETANCRGEDHVILPTAWPRCERPLDNPDTTQHFEKKQAKSPNVCGPYIVLILQQNLRSGEWQSATGSATQCPINVNADREVEICELEQNVPFKLLHDKILRLDIAVCDVAALVEVSEGSARLLHEARGPHR